jgi:hypothetical protein
MECKTTVIFNTFLCIKNKKGVFFMLNIQKFQIKFNVSKRTEKIQWLVVHYTGNPGAGANSLMHYKYFNGGDRQSSADFFVDDHSILQVNDYNRNFTWHCGDGAGKYGITNRNSLGIEMCINSDGDFNKTLLNTIELVRYLMKELNIPIDRVVRHWDCSRKLCPMMFAGTPEKDKLWLKFKTAVLGYEAIIKANTSDPKLWLDFIENNKTGILQYSKDLFQKVYIMGIMEPNINDWKLILKKCLSNPDAWINEVSKHKYLDILLTKIFNA